MPHCNKYKISFFLQILWIADRIIEVVTDEKSWWREGVGCCKKTYRIVKNCQNKIITLQGN
jgi:hypothetical protein